MRSLGGKAQESKSKRRDYNATARAKKHTLRGYDDVLKDIGVNPYSDTLKQTEIRDRMVAEIKAKIAAKKAAKQP